MTTTGQSRELTTLITGGFAKVPGGAVQQVLAKGTELQIVPEPTNPYDPHALQVWVSVEEIPQSQMQELADRLEGTGWDMAAVMEAERIQLGFVASSSGKPLQKLGWTIGNKEFIRGADDLGLPAEGPWPGRLGFTAEGLPLISLQVGEPSP